MIRKYDNTKNYGSHQIGLINLEVQFEILNELKKLNKTMKQVEAVKRLPKKENK